jgi:hypothetical protein
MNTPENLPLLLPPGINSDVSRYMANLSWWDGNLVRWSEKGVLEPVGGWQKLYDISGPTEPIRDMYSWTDNAAVAYLAVGSTDKAIVRKITDGTTIDVTPTDLVTAPSGATGFGSGSFGVGRFGLDSSNNSSGGVDTKFGYAYWTFDNWGEDLLGVHTIDGRLMRWLPSTPTTDFVGVSGAPIANRLCLVTDERHVMVMGGAGNPRRIKWCAREDITDWTPTALNSAGGFELDTSGLIVSAIKVPQGVLVLTDCDIHLVEYIGPPNYYAPRLISDETGVVSPKAVASLPNGAIFAGQHSFWMFNGGISKLSCSLSDFVFELGNLDVPKACFMGINEAVQEIWFFFPAVGEVEASRYVNFHYSADLQWWSKGLLSRTAWLNPVWQSRPVLANNLAIYEHERGWTDNGATRNVYAESGSLEISNGDWHVAVKRFYHDTIRLEGFTPNCPVPYNVEFKLSRSANCPDVSYGPIQLSNRGYTAMRFKARQISMKITEIASGKWGFGKARLTIKPVGKR